MTMNPALSAFNHVVAFEVAKDSLVIHVLPADKQSVAANKPKAIRKVLLAEIQRGAEDGLGAMLVVCERPAAMSAMFLRSAWSLALPSTRPTDRAFAISPGISACSPKPIRSTLAFLRFMGSRPPIFASMFRRRLRLWR